MYLFHYVIGPIGPDWHGTACEVDYGDKLQLTRHKSINAVYIHTRLSDVRASNVVYSGPILPS